MSTQTPYPILFITSNLGGGGAERALVNIINHLNRNRFRPYLALFQREGEFLNKLSGDVPIHEIQGTDYGFLHRNWVRYTALNKLYREIHPALVMSIKWQANAAALLSKLARVDFPVVINEQSAPQASLLSDRRRRILWPFAKRLYPQADKLIVISKGIASELESTSQIPFIKIQVIHNPISLKEITTQGRIPVKFKSPDVPAILAAGRLIPLKNYPLLLKAVAHVLKTHRVELFILGQGPEKSTIQALANQLGISDYVHLLGFVPHPHAYIAQADIFALTSNHEGFGNVLVEAMALGIPVVATDCPYGPREILADGQYGELAPVGDEVALTKALLTLLDHPEKRAHLATEGKRRAQDFSIEKIIPQYEQTFLELIEN